MLPFSIAFGLPLSPQNTNVVTPSILTTSRSALPPSLSLTLSLSRSLPTVINAVNDYTVDAAEELLETLLARDAELDPIAMRRVS